MLNERRERDERSNRGIECLLCHHMRQVGTGLRVQPNQTNPVPYRRPAVWPDHAPDSVRLSDLQGKERGSARSKDGVKQDV